MLKAARAHAALMDRKKVVKEDVQEAARFALPHRVRLTPLSQPETASKDLEMLLGAKPMDGSAATDEAFEEEDRQVPGATAAGSIVFTYLKKKRARSSSTPRP